MGKDNKINIYKYFLITTLMVLTMTTFFMQQVKAEEEKTIIGIMIKGEIDAGQAALVRRALHDAEAQKAQAVFVEIDTFGGRVDAAVSIRDMITNTNLPTICYIKNRAWSAGALISIAHKNIAIAPGGSIGAAEPVLSNGEPAGPKAVAALKAEFAATANKTGRNPKVAEAMVDKALGFPGYAQPGEILALTDYQAIELGYADLVAPEREDVLKHFGYAGAKVVEYVPGTMEKVVGWLSDPAVKSLLLGIIVLVIMTEIKTAGVGVAAMIGVGAALLFFGSQWMTGLAGWFELILFLGGVVLIFIELFAPSAGIFALGGIIAIIASFFLTLGADGTALIIISSSIALAIIAFLFIVKKLPSSGLWARFTLQHSQANDLGYVSRQSYEEYLGKRGTSITLLRPAGTIEVDGEFLDVVSEGQFIEPGKAVKIISVSGSRILVRLDERE